MVHPALAPFASWAVVSPEDQLRLVSLLAMEQGTATLPEIHAMPLMTESRGLGSPAGAVKRPIVR